MGGLTGTGHQLSGSKCAAKRQGWALYWTLAFAPCWSATLYNAALPLYRRFSHAAWSCTLGNVVLVPISPRQPGLILNPCLDTYINVCRRTPPNVILISVLYYAHPESRLWNRIRALVEVISQFWVCICSIDLQYVNSCNAGLAYGPSASLEARPAWCLITERLSRVLSVN